MKKLAPSSVGSKTVAVSEDDLDRYPFSGCSIIIRMLRSALHDNAGTLLARLDEELLKLGRFMGAIMLLYGLCRTTRYDMQRFIDRWEVPLTFLTEEDGIIADDCFGAVLGGRKKYLATMKENKGTIFITTG